MKKMSSEEEEAEGETTEWGWLQSHVNCYRVLGGCRKAEKQKGNELQAGTQCLGLASTSSKLSNSTELGQQAIY